MIFIKFRGTKVINNLEIEKFRNVEIVECVYLMYFVWSVRRFDYVCFFYKKSLFRNKDCYGHLLLNSDSTFEYKCVSGMYKEYSTGYWSKNIDNTINLNSNHKSNLIPLVVDTLETHVFGNVDVKLISSYITDNGTFGVRVLPYINQEPCILMFDNTDSISLIFTKPIKTLSFVVEIIKPGSLKRFQTETIFFEEADAFILFFRKLNIKILLDETLANYKVFDNTKVILDKRKIQIEDKANKKINVFKIYKKHNKY